MIGLPASFMHRNEDGKGGGVLQVISQFTVFQYKRIDKMFFLVKKNIIRNIKAMLKNI